MRVEYSYEIQVHRLFLVPFLLNKLQFYSYVIPAKPVLSVAEGAGINSIISGFRIKCGMTKSESFFLETALAINSFTYSLVICNL